MGEAFVQEALAAHNVYRDAHGMKRLTLNQDLVDRAQKWADHLAATNSFAHCPDRAYRDGKPMGENIAMRWSSGGGEFTAQQATDQWYSEIENIDFATCKSHNGKPTGHFTQVVWKCSEEFGIGKAQDSNGKWLVVGNYFPAGNLIGTEKENVFPRTDGTIPKVMPDKSSGGGGSGAGAGDGGMQPGAKKSTSTKTMTEIKDGQKITRTIVTETITNPDGSTQTKTKESVKTESM